jgi:regulator of replication initiation timing
METQQQPQQAPTTLAETMVINLGRQIDDMVKSFNAQMTEMVEKLNTLSKENTELKAKLTSQTPVILPGDAS